MSAALIDRFGRKIDYLRISVTDRCDLRCSYCLPQGFTDFDEPANWLDFEQISRLVAVFARLGVSRIRLTGGEPLLRRNLPVLAGRISAIAGINDLSLSSNGTLLERHAAALRQAGVARINLSLDSLDRGKFERIAGRDALARVLRGIDAAQAAGFELRVNMVVIPAVNQDEIETMVAFCRERDIVLRLIEPMPVGDTGRAAGTFDLQPTMKQLARKFGLIPSVVPGGGPARYLQSADGSFRIGFITPVSQHFCETCNRVRLSPDGMLHLCLGQDDRVDLGKLLKDGATDGELEAAIVAAIAAKPERHEFRETPQKILRFMSATGG